MVRCANKVAVVTGAATGIGRVYAKALATEGAAVAILDIDDAGAKRTAAEITRSGGEAVGLRCDIGSEEEVEAAIAAAAKRFGGIDILVNNAARHLLTYNRPVTELPRDMWLEMLEVNVLGVIACSRACRESMRARGSGVIVNQSSIAGFTSEASYGITKLAVRGLTVALANEFAVDNIRVLGIAPGATESEAALAALPPSRFDYFVDKQLIKRRGTMEDLVGTLLFFCSSDSAFITGETLIVGGGFPLRV
jgi:NAD(P)-dependent dehydrogenase (short-subunit alcohol dehydrogenase family)